MNQLFTIFLIIVSLQTFSQNACRIRVEVFNSLNNAVLSGAQVYVVTQGVSYMSNNYGIVDCEISCSGDSLFVSYLGFNDTVLILNKNFKPDISVALIPNEFDIQKVTITKQKIDDNLTKSIGEISMQRAQLRSLPSFMGEPDVLRTLAASGGVRQIEGMQGIFVRGGSQDQNLIVYDGATIYNPSHLLGFFSVFNSDIIQSATLFSSGAPAMYGGRLSSVLAIQSQPAILDSIETKISVGVLSSRCMINAPISNKSALRASFRKTYLNLFVMPLVEKSLQLREEVSTEFGFTDATFRFDYKPNTQHIFYVSGYAGGDIFRLDNSQISLQNKANWGNIGVAVQWKYLSPKNWVHTTTASFSKYNFDFAAQQSLYSLHISTGVSKYALQYIAKKRLDSHTFMYGLSSDFQTFNSGTVDVSINNQAFIASPALLSQCAEQSMFIEHNWQIIPKLSSVISFRVVPYFLLGPSSYVQYNEVGEIADTLKFYTNQIIYSNVGIEPRIQLQYKLSTESTVKLSCMRTTQHTHMVSMLSAALPADIWMPAGIYNPRMYGWISSVGVYKNWNNNMFETSLSLYYKTMNNIIEFKDGFITLYANSYNQKITRGKGYACGAEFALSKQIGEFTGAISYNFSRTLRKFKELNSGYLYPASYDKPHDVSVQIQYELSKSLKFSGLWVYSSGKVYSEPVSKYFIGKNVVSEYGALNSSRMSAYHRLDIGAEYVIIQNNKFELATQLSVYNVYNRNNVYYIYYEMQGNVEEFSLQFVKNYVGLFPILPSVSVQLNF